MDKKKNFQRFKGPFACNVEFVVLGIQYHPNARATYKDYLRLKKSLEAMIRKIVKSERPEEIAEWRRKRREEKELEEEKKALKALDEKRLEGREQTEDSEETQDEKPIIEWEDGK